MNTFEWNKHSIRDNICDNCVFGCHCRSKIGIAFIDHNPDFKNLCIAVAQLFTNICYFNYFACVASVRKCINPDLNFLPCTHLAYINFIHIGFTYHLSKIRQRCHHIIPSGLNGRANTLLAAIPVSPVYYHAGFG